MPCTFLPGAAGAPPIHSAILRLWTEFLPFTKEVKSMKTHTRTTLALLLALLISSTLATPVGGTAPKPEPDRIIAPR